MPRKPSSEGWGFYPINFGHFSCVAQKQSCSWTPLRAGVPYPETGNNIEVGSTLGLSEVPPPERQQISFLALV
ncbi:MAG TPA: hypothetical protein V6C90_00595 [Coleofasciculaceae cyanobacterium]